MALGTLAVAAARQRPSPVTGGREKRSFVVRLNSEADTSFLKNLSFRLSVSSSSFPLSPAISTRFVPGASPVVTANSPVAPPGYSSRALTSSSTSMGWYSAKADLRGDSSGEPREPLQEIQVVGGLVDQHAPALARPRSPASRRSRSRRASERGPWRAR